MPVQKRKPEEFDAHFSSVGLEPLAKFRRAQENTALKKSLMSELDELLSGDATQEEIVERCQHHIATTTLTDVDVTVMVSVHSK